MEGVACAVGRLGPDGPWLGFAPAIQDGYELVVGGGSTPSRHAADADDLLCLAIAYFEDELDAPPEDLAATHADIGSVVRHVLEHEAKAERRRLLGEAVDAIDDGLPADAVVGRLRLCLVGAEDPVARLTRRATEGSGGRLTP
ncbi:MAG TPA: hypothetical protein VFN76_01570 [Candidatus Limnocylindria bacterium]|nr:hypothetical protein [Candidatus Limnocylindria bacterium]